MADSQTAEPSLPAPMPRPPEGWLRTVRKAIGITRRILVHCRQEDRDLRYRARGSLRRRL